MDRARYIYADRSSSRLITEDTDSLFVRDSSIDKFVHEDDIVNGFVDMMCKAYIKSVDNGKLPVPDTVLEESLEFAGASVQGINWVRANFDTMDDKNGLINKAGCVDWDKVGDYFCTFDVIYKKYTGDGNCSSVKTFAKLLSDKGFPAARKTVGGKQCNVRLGIKQAYDYDTAYDM